MCVREREQQTVRAKKTSSRLGRENVFFSVSLLHCLQSFFFTKQQQKKQLL